MGWIILLFGGVFMNLKRDTYAIVDLDHLKYNVELAHSEFKRPLMAVIKADAYGHGYKEVASFLKDIDYIEMFAVATLQEAIVPMRGRSIPLTSSYSLEIRNDSVISYLPYYGRAYSIPYGGGDGLNFKAVLKEYSMEMDKKGNAVIEFIARNPEDRYEYRVKVFPNGSASIDVNMQNRQSISFQGELYIKEEK